MYNENPKAIGRVISVDVLYNNCTIEFSHGQQRCEYQYVKPHLFPMSSLTKEIEFGGNRFVPIVELRELFCELPVLWFNVKLIDHVVVQEMSFKVVQWLIEHHFNIFGLSPEEFIEVSQEHNPYK